MKKMENKQFYSISFLKSALDGCVAPAVPFYYVVRGSSSKNHPYLFYFQGHIHLVCQRCLSEGIKYGLIFVRKNL